MVNGTVIKEPSFELSETIDDVEYKKQKAEYTGNVYYMFHKPAGCITARKDASQRTVMDYLEKDLRYKVFPVGRLDKDTEGLLFFTNDGDFDYRLMNPKNHVSKRYFFIALGNLKADAVERIEQGLSIGENKLTNPAKIEVTNVSRYYDFLQEANNSMLPLKDLKGTPSKEQKVISGYLTITEGCKHQVKRMLKAVGCYVIYLKRETIGSVELDPELRPGQYRTLTEEELCSLR